ncbi:MAG: SURF1 family protein [Rhodobacteraceae bacterium]|nr:SURF1 family protein [Paracoccaceae bacterium]
MNKRMIAPIVFGIVGIAILVSLGNWQVRRLVWKEAILAAIEVKIGGPAVPVPEAPNREAHMYLHVLATGEMGAGEVHVLSSSFETGPGYRIIVPFTLENGRRILVDRGVVPEAVKNAERALENGRLEGNLLWMQDPPTFPPDLGKNIWFNRDTEALAEALGTEAVLLVMSHTTLSTGPHPVAVGVNIPNSHLGYAVTWYGFALVWLGMTLYLLYRIKRKTV